MNQKPIERLPPSCTLMIARYYYSFAGRKLPSTETMRNFVYEAHLKDPPASQEGSTAIIKCLREQGTTIRKLSEMLNCIKPTLQAILCAAQQTSTYNTFTAPNKRGWSCRIGHLSIQSHFEHWLRLSTPVVFTVFYKRYEHCPKKVVYGRA